MLNVFRVRARDQYIARLNETVDITVKIAAEDLAAVWALSEIRLAPLEMRHGLRHLEGELRLLAHVPGRFALAVTILDGSLSAFSQALLKVGFLAVAELPVDLLEHSVVRDRCRVRRFGLDLAEGRVRSPAFHL